MCPFCFEDVGARPSTPPMSALVPDVPGLPVWTEAVAGDDTAMGPVHSLQNETPEVDLMDCMNMTLRGSACESTDAALRAVHEMTGNCFRRRDNFEQINDMIRRCLDEVVWPKSSMILVVQFDGNYVQVQSTF